MWSYLLCSLSLIGIPPTGGFLSKWYLAAGALSSGFPVFSYLGPVILLLSALLTAGYLLPLAVDAFFPGKEAASLTGSQTGEQTAGISPSMLVPIAVLTVLGVIVGIFPGPVLRYIEGIIQMVGGFGL